MTFLKNINKIMLHISRFIDKIKMLENKQSKNFPMTMREAKDLHSDITRLLLTMNELQTKFKKENTNTQKIDLDGGDW